MAALMPPTPPPTTITAPIFCLWTTISLLTRVLWLSLQSKDYTSFSLKKQEKQMRDGWWALFTTKSPFLDTIFANHIIHILSQDASTSALLEPWLLQKDKYDTIGSTSFVSCPQRAVLGIQPTTYGKPIETQQIAICSRWIVKSSGLTADLAIRCEHL
jgi:hypothetical protein